MGKPYWNRDAYPERAWQLRNAAAALLAGQRVGVW
jgi:hypothetical protein